MNLDEIEKQGFILALFIRDDGQRFLLGTGAYEFKEDQLHFAANTMTNDVVEIQGNDGYMLAGQVRRPTTQVFDGYIGDASVNRPEVETYRRDFFAFFLKNHFYTVVYIFPNGSAIQRRRGFIVDCGEVKELYQIFPEYHIGMNFEDVNYYKYSEDSDGHEIYGKSATVGLSLDGYGGLIWDEYGVVWDSYGAEWEEGGGGVTTVSVDSIENVYPVWKVVGPTNNPTLENITTGTTISYSGNVAVGQTLVVDMLNETAKLNGTSVIGNISGKWLEFAPGNNRVSYTATNSTAPSSTIEWQEIVG